MRRSLYASDVILYTINHDGGTFILNNGRFEIVERKSGYAISYGYEFKTRSTYEAYRYLQDNKLNLKDGDVVGTWVNNYEIYIERTTIINNKKIALLRAKIEKQEAIYSFKAKASILLSDYNLNDVILFEKVNHYELSNEGLSFGRKIRLNKCNAYIAVAKNNINDNIVIYYSYNTILLIQVNNNVFFNRLDYSSTTRQHLSKFIKRYHLECLDWYQLNHRAWTFLVRDGIKDYSQYGVKDVDEGHNEVNSSYIIDIEKVLK